METIGRIIRKCKCSKAKIKNGHTSQVDTTMETIPDLEGMSPKTTHDEK